VKLEMIKIALVQQNDALYQVNIADATQWVKTNFTKNKVSKSILSSLDSLKTVQLRNQFPDISQSLKMLKDITKLRIETDKAQMMPTRPRVVKKKLPQKVIKKPVISEAPVTEVNSDAPVAP